MKKLQVPLEDETMLALKNYTFRNNITIKEFVTNLIEKGIGEIPTIQTQPTTPTPPPEEEKPRLDLSTVDYDKFFVMRRTHELRLDKTGGTRRWGPLEWTLFEGCYNHYDADGNIIPCRYTASDGEVMEPDDNDIKYMEEMLKKKVIFE